MPLAETADERVESVEQETFTATVELCRQVILPLALAHRQTLDWDSVYAALMQACGAEIS